MYKDSWGSKRLEIKFELTSRTVTMLVQQDQNSDLTWDEVLEVYDLLKDLNIPHDTW